MLLPILEKLNQKKIILASASSNRKMILEKTGMKFEISASNFEEDLPKEDFKTSKDYVIKTSEMKLLHKIEEFKKQNNKVDIIISADTIISLDDKKVIEKPESKEHAFKILRELSDKGSHEVYTSVWIAFLNNETQEIIKIENIIDCTKVFFENIDDATLMAYINTGEPFGKAGGYGIQGQAATFISKIEGDFYSVWGFPFALFCKKLREMFEN